MEGEDIRLSKAIDIARSHEATIRDNKDMRVKTVNYDLNVDAVGHPKFARAAKPCNNDKPRKANRTSAVHEFSQDDPYEDYFTVSSVRVAKVSNSNDSEALRSIKVRTPCNKTGSMTIKVDTGARVNLLPIRAFRIMFPDLLDAHGKPKTYLINNRQKNLIAVNNIKLKHFGLIKLKCTFDEKNWIDTDFYILDQEVGPNILGLPSLRALGMVTNHEAWMHPQPTTAVQSVYDLKKSYLDQFDKIGSFHGKYHIVKEGSRPVVHAQRKFPIHKKEELQNKLEDMEKIGVIKKVSEPTDWVNSMVCTMKKDGSLRICLDPKDLNKAIKRSYHKTPTQEEFTHKFADSKYFSKLDVKNGYWSVTLDETSSFLTTFNTPFGRYRYLRMPFGLVMSQDVFQQKMDQILENCPGTIGIADDVVVFGKTEEEHDINLHNFFKIAKQKGLTFNRAKCVIKPEQVKFIGTVYDKEGSHPDPDKVSAIKALPSPTNVTELQQCLGIVTYMSPFIPNLADETAPLRSLLKKGIDFTWSPTHEKAFEHIKNILCTDATLAHFNPNKPTVIQVDASQKGIGAALVQDDKPIAYASKSLSETEQCYANIERELLAVVFGCERFHTYVYGKAFLVESDHKPLEMIQLKNLTATPPRLQRMLMRLQHYDVTIRYKPGKDLLLADGLSCLPSTDNQHIGLDRQINFVTFSNEKLVSLRQETSKDVILHGLKDVIIQGWPEKMKDLPRMLQPYWSFRDEISIEDGLVIKGSKFVIPASMQKIVLDRIHEGHQGITKCQLRAKDCVYWISINRDIEDLVQQCSICQETSRSHTKETLIPHELPTRPWQYVGTDLFHYGGNDFLIIAEYYSKFPVIRKMPMHVTSQAVIKGLKNLFSEYGVPEKVYSDNGRQYSSEEFATFASNWEFEHITSSPHYPQSNGFIERTIQTVKNTIDKAKRSNKDPEMALLTLRTTPLDSKLPSPAELLIGRKMRKEARHTEAVLRPRSKRPANTPSRPSCSSSRPHYWKMDTRYSRGEIPRTSIIHSRNTRWRYLTKKQTNIRQTPQPKHPLPDEHHAEESTGTTWNIDNEQEHVSKAPEVVPQEQESTCDGTRTRCGHLGGSIGIVSDSHGEGSRIETRV
ncbi:uncharacterized protein K02A2.6-like [Penaeus chinensis]|uniref:uncharacterized protein K02A2.6-like n=1 Tax=Penaeus chinensis TaxID=139456 RepID=UPI001FB7BB97|nr:uncharacterized protein K02A2.6-like [Penaeus chinensis]